MEETRTNGSKESPLQREAFLIYFNLGKERSLEKLHQELTKTTPKNSKCPVVRTLKEWSVKYGWVDKVQTMDQEVADRAEQIAIKEATLEKSKIIQFVRNVFIRANQAVISGEMTPSVSDVKKAWEIERVELGRSTGLESNPAPAINIFLTKNQKIINVVKEAQDQLRKVLESETKQDD